MEISERQQRKLAEFETVVLQERLRLLDLPADLDRLVAASRRRADQATEDEAEHASLAVAHAAFLLRRFHRWGDHGALNDAIARLESVEAGVLGEAAVADGRERARWFAL